METDYLIIGSGAVGMAFVDTLLDESDAHITIVDRHAKPGGHWNDAYPFVTLHQPSAYYGVNSTELGSRRKDDSGPNAGLYEMATGPEINAYYDAVMRQRFLP
ncbi:MAG: NAD(P)-binding protein, partial [Burkholderiaceae bacterium]